MPFLPDGTPVDIMLNPLGTFAYEYRTSTWITLRYGCSPIRYSRRNTCFRWGQPMKTFGETVREAGMA